MFERLPLHIKKALAWSVHLFTATGAIWGFLSLLAIFEQNWRAAILWIIVAMFVDGFDGMLARWFHVKEYARGVDGALLDNIIDYLNYVVVAALILSIAVAALLRWAMVGWRALTLSFAAAVIGAGVATIAHTFAV